MSNTPDTTSSQWMLALGTIESRIEDLKVRSDTEYRTLHRRLDAQIEELQRELKELADEIAAAAPDLYIQSISTQLNELKAKGDAAYELLQATLATATGGKQEAKHGSRDGSSIAGIDRKGHV